MSLHKHHLLQVQEQIFFFLWSSSDTTPGRGAGLGAGGRGQPRPRAAVLAWHHGLLATPAGLAAHSPASPGGRELPNALPSQGTHLPLVTAEPEPIPQTGAPSPAPRGQPCRAPSVARACQCRVPAPDCCFRALGTGCACCRGRGAGGGARPGGQPDVGALMGGTCVPNATRLQKLN